MMQKQGESPVTVFVIDGRVNDRYLSGPLQRLHQGASHGDLVTWIIRNEAPRVQVKGISIEDKSGTIDHNKYLHGLDYIKRYKKQHPGHRVLVNISLSFARDKGQSETINKLNNLGVKIIAAAGNDNSSKPIYPAAFSGVIAVANANRKGKAESSNYGQYIEISAPGDIEYIERAYFPGQTLTREMKHIGTSFSAPRVTGVMAHILKQKSSLTTDQAFTLIKDSASSIASSLYYEGALGAGLVNKKKAISKIDSSFSLWKKIQVIAGVIILSAIIYLFWQQEGFVGIFLFVLLSLMIIPLMLGIIPILLMKFDKFYLFIAILLVVSFYVLSNLIKWVFLKVIKHFNPGLSLLFIMLSYPDQDIRNSIKNSLKKYPDDKLESFLLNKLKTIVNPGKKEIVLELLALQDQPPFKEILEACLHDNRLLDKTGKILSQHSGGQNQIIDLLLYYLRSGERDYQKLSANLFIYFDHEKLKPIFKDFLKDCLNNRVDNSGSIFVLEALEKAVVVDSDLIQLLYQIIEQKSVMWVRYQALRALAKIAPHDKRYYDLIKKLTDDSQQLVRMEAQNFYFDFS